jgi:hypothetical protein
VSNSLSDDLKNSFVYRPPSVVDADKKIDQIVDQIFDYKGQGGIWRGLVKRYIRNNSNASERVDLINIIKKIVDK